MEVTGKLTVKNGSEFSGGRHTFQDSEKAGVLRVGGAWERPGIYSENGDGIVVGSSNGKILLNGNVYNKII